MTITTVLHSRCSLLRLKYLPQLIQLKTRLMNFFLHTIYQFVIQPTNLVIVLNLEEVHLFLEMFFCHCQTNVEFQFWNTYGHPMQSRDPLNVSEIYYISSIQDILNLDQKNQKSKQTGTHFHKMQFVKFVNRKRISLKAASNTVWIC